MKFSKLTNKIKLSSALIVITTVVVGAFLSVPLLLSTNHTNNQIVSNNLDYKNIIDQDNNKSTGSSDFSSQPAAIQDFFSIYVNKKIYTSSNSESLFAVVTKDDGFHALYAWGANGYSKLGIGAGPDVIYSSYPTLVNFTDLSNYKITHIALSQRASTVVIDGDQIWTVGYNGYNEHGNTDWSDPPISIFTKSGNWPGGAIKSIHAGYNYRVAVTANNKVYVWGYNEYGQLGTGSKDKETTPRNITNIISTAIPNWYSTDEFSFYANEYNTAMLVKGKLYMWGAGSNGRLGNNGTVDVPTPPTTPVTLPSKILKYSMGGSHSLALLENGDLYSWGENDQGQLGIDSTKDSPIPTKVTDMFDDTSITGVTDVFTSNSSSFIQIDNKIYSCGDNSFGILAQGSTIVNNKIFFPVKLDSSVVINSVNATGSTLIVNLDSGLYMAGGNGADQFASGDTDKLDHDTLTQVSPFGNIKLGTKPDNTKYKADYVVTDLINQTTAQEIRDTLTKYVDGIDSIPLESTLSYEVAPTASADKSKVTLTLKTNRSFGTNGAKISGDYDFPIEITNFRITESTIIIKNKPTGVHTGNIQTILNPNPGSVPPAQWLNEIIDMDEFPFNTTFIKIIDDKITVGTGANSTYEGNIVVSQYYANGGTITVSEKPFPFIFNGLTRVEDSLIVTLPIPSDYDINNIEAGLIEGTTIKKDELSKFIDINRFPPNTTFTTDAVVNKDPATGKFTFNITPSHHYVGGIYVDNSTAKISYSVTIQFATPSNLWLIIGSTVGGVVLLGIIILLYAKRYDIQIARWNKKAMKFQKKLFN